MFYEFWALGGLNKIISLILKLFIDSACLM